MKIVLSLVLFLSLISYAKAADDPQGDPSSQEGAKILRVERNSVYSKLGLKSGDVIKAINGRAVVTSSSAQSLGELMKKADQIDIEVLRNGKTVHVKHTVE